MNRTNYSRFFYLFLSFSLLIAPLPLSAIAENLVEKFNIFQSRNDEYSANSYVYLGQDASNIAEIIEEINQLNDNSFSLLYDLNEHIQNGFDFAEYNAVLETLDYADTVLRSHYKKLDPVRFEELATSLDAIIDQVIDGDITINFEDFDEYTDEMLLRSSTKKINRNLYVSGKTTLQKHLHTKQGIHAQGKLKIGKKAQFKNNVSIAGDLSVDGDVTLNGNVDITHCIDNVCVNNIEAINISTENLTVTDSLVLTNISLSDLTIGGTLSANDAVVQDLTVAHCMTNLCVNNLSVVDESISGTLSVNNATIQNLTLTGALSFTDLSVVDATISGSLTVSDLVVENCITNVCVNNLSVVDESISGTLSVSNAAIENLTLTGAISFTDISVVDATVSGSLTVSDLVVENCVTNLCVDNLSVTDQVIETFLRFQDPGINYIGIQAPVTVPTSYTLTLPANAPTANQVLTANALIPTNLEWAAQSGGSSVLPAISRIIYVTTYGNDVTGNGSYTAPYATLAKAINLANTLSSATDPITISMNPGVYVENNNVGPLTITADGMSIVGDSANGVIIEPSMPNNNLILSNNALQIINITFQSSTPSATGITLSGDNLSILENVYVYNFLIGIQCMGGTTSSYEFNNCLFIANGTALNVNNVHVACNNSTFSGSFSLVGPAANTGVTVNGSGANVVISGGLLGICTTGLNISNNAFATISGVSFRINAFDVVQSGASQLTLSGCTFEIANSSADIDIQVSGAGTVANITSCEFDGLNSLGVAEGTGIMVSDNASVNISGGSLHNYITGLQVGLSIDTSSTSLAASALVIRDCTTDIVQQGSTSLNLNASTATSPKISINDASNVTLAFFDLDTGDALTIGSINDQDTTLLQVAIATANNPEINYYSSLYGSRAIGFDNSLLTGQSTWFMLSNGNADLTAITTDRTQIAGLQLYSDEGSPIGGTSALRGWDLNKNGSDAALSFNYQNSDIVGQIAIPQYTVMQLDGFNNQLQLPAAGTQIVFDTDTNLYRSSAGVLQTDSNFIVGTLTPDRVVVTAPVTNQLASSAVTGTELGYLSGVTSSIQTQLNGKVSKSGDTMTGPLSATDIVVTNLSVTSLSATDAIMQNATITTLSLTDEIIQNSTVTNLSVVDATVTGTLSVLDAIIQNSTITNLSSTDAIIQNGTIASFSATDEIIQNSTITNLSSTDAIIQTLTVNNCIANLCVNNLSVVDESVSGTLSVNNEVVQNILQFNSSGGNFVGIKAPATIPTSYTVSLPSAAPTANQVLHANATTPTNLEWFTAGGSVTPTSSKTIYVAKYGNDSTGNGSFDAPYLTLSKAITIANGIASTANPIAIMMSSGIYVENNSAGPLSVTTNGISIVGASTNSVIISPSTPANDLLSINNTARIADITIQSATPSATGISFSAGTLSVVSNVRIVNFLTGISCAGGSSASYGFNDCLFVDNGTALLINNAFVECNNCTLFGVPSLSGPAANTGIDVTGSSARLVLSGGVFGVFNTGISINNNATVTISSVSFRSNSFDIVQSGPSTMVISGSTFELTNTTSDIEIQVSGAGAIAEIISCEFNGDNAGGTTEATGIVVSNNATVYMSGGTVHNYDTALQIGISTDTSSTKLFASGVGIHDCITDILQQGAATLNFNAGTATSSKITVSDPTNVTLAFFDLDMNNALTIGSTANQNTTLVQTAIASANNPEINYYPSIYGSQAIGFDNSLLTNPSSWFILSNANADLTAITTDRTQIAGLQLYSDEGSPIGGTSALRGWDINKNGSEAALSFNYQNSDIVGQVAVPQYTVMQLDGLNNQLQLPTAGTQIVFDSDTNLYRSGVGVLQTDDNFVVGTLTPGNVVITDPITNQLSSSDITAAELEFLSGTVAAIQVQLNEKVNKSGDTMTGTLELPAGTTASPSLVFSTGSSLTGLSASGDNLSFSNAGVESMKISSAGVVSIDGFAGAAGVVHSDASGNLSSSLIVNADITNATIANAKLATISSSDIPGNIVVRDGSGNFATNMISIDGTVANPTDAATKAYVDAAISTGLVAHTPAVVVSTTDIGSPPAGLQTIDGIALNTNDRVLLVGQTNPVENGLWLAQSGNWTRPADFASGTVAGQAYVLILEGTAFEGSSWLCNTPDAIIDTDPIEFSLFTLPNTTSGANVGSGTGLVYQGKTGVTLNFRTLFANDIYTAITTGTNTVSIGTNATNVNTPSTIVARDSSGNFSAGTITANVTGTASNNLLLTGGTLTGTLQLPAGTTALPSLVFTGSTTTGLSASSGALSLSTNGAQAIKISSAGVVSINNLAGTAGVVHNDASGNLSSSLIVNADISPTAAITDSKLATISTAGKVANSATTAVTTSTPNTIVLRDGSGNVTANTFIGSLTGHASLDLPLTGGTLTGTLQLPAGTTALPSLIFTGSTTAGLSANSGNLSFSTNGAEQMKISSGGIISIDGFTAAGVVHNDPSGNLSSSLIVNADISATATITDSKLATISTAGKVANSATTATNLNTANAIVARDSSGNFSAGTITANLSGNATTATTATNSTNFTGSLSGDVTGTQSATVVSLVGGQTAATVAAATVTVDAATPLNTPTTLVERDGSGNFAAGSVTANLIGNVTGNVSGSAASFTGSLSGDVTGTQSATVVSTVGGQTAANVAAATVLANAATPLNTPSTIVERNASGNFAAGTITASLSGNATTATTATNFSGSLSGDVTGTQSATVVSTVGGQTAANVAAATVLANAATPLDTPSTIVERDSSGNFAATTIVASLTGAASLNVLKAGDTMTGTLQLPAGTTALPSLVFTGSTTAGLSATSGALSFSTNALERMKISSGGTISIDGFTTAGVVHNDSSGNLSSSLIVNADISATAAITDSKLATISTAGKVANSATTATNLNTASAIVARDASGNFSAGTITANLNGNATTATSAGSFSGSLAGDVTGTQSATVVSFVGGQTAANVAAATVLANAATPLNTPSTIVERDSSGNFSAGTITASLTGGASLDLPLAGGTLTGTLTIPAGTAAAPSFQFTGGTNTGMSSATANTLSFDTSGVERMKINSSGVTIDAFSTAGVVHNSAAGLLTSSLIVNADITAGTIANSALATISSSNIAGDIVVRDGSGNFSAGTITANLTGTVTGHASLDLPLTGGTLTGTLTVPAGTAAAPSFQFTGGTNTGISSATANTLSFDTSGVERMNISSSGVTIDAFSTAGVVHNSAAGLLTSSLIVNADITPATITNASLATISSSNIAGDIVVRDGSGNFSAGTITASLTGGASLDLPLAGGTLTGTLTIPAGTAAAPSFQFTGGTNTGISSATANTLSFDTSGVERMNISSSGVTIDAFSTAGVVHNSAAGLLSSSLIVNADITAGTIANSALATISSSNIAGDIVVRDGSGNFSAGTITASLTGGASLDLPLAGGTLTGTLTIPAGTAAAPSFQFTGGTNTGISSATANTLSFDTSGVERMKINSSGVTIDAFSTAGVVHNSAAGLLTSSLIVNADITPATITNASLATISSTNTAGNIVVRDGSGNFSAGTITASLNGNATTATSAGSFSGSLSGDVTGTQSATVVSLVGGQTAANVAAATVLANAATPLDTPSTIVERDGSGNFAVTTINASGNLVLGTSTSTSGNIIKGGNVFLSNFGGNIFMGQNVGNFTTSGGSNIAFGSGALFADTSGDFNIAMGVNALGGNTTGSANFAFGFHALQVNTTGSSNIAIGNSALFSATTGGQNIAIGNGSLALQTTDNNNIAIGFNAGSNLPSGSNNIYISNLGGPSSESNTIRIGTAHTSCNIAGISGVTPGGTAVPVIINSSGQLGTQTLTPAGVVHNNASGVLSTSLIVNADITPATIANSALATISSSNIAGDIVVRDGSGNFSAGTITANLIGTVTGGASLDLPLTGGTLTGTLTLPAGTAAAPSLQFTGSTNTGISAATANTLSFDIVGSEQMNISSVGVNVTQTISAANLSLPASTSAASGNILKNGSVFIQNFGTDNIFIGLNSGNFTLTGTGNVSMGTNTGQSLTSGVQNTSIGAYSSDTLTSGSNNTFIGYTAGESNITGNSNTAIGDAALQSNSVSGNTAVGASALQTNSTGISNVAVGLSALQANSTGSSNTAVGAGALQSNTIGTSNTAVGSGALAINSVGVSNTAVGANSLQANTTGTSNTAVGVSSLALNTTGISNTAIGATALIGNTTGASNTAVGSAALAANTSGNNNTAVGTNALTTNTLGNTNTAIGFNALTATSVSGNTAVGSSSLAANTTGTGNTAVGLSALAVNTTGIDNTAVGASALATNTVGTTNTAVGFNALTVNTVSGNTAVGSSSLAANTTGTGNTAVGLSSLAANTTGIDNTAVGASALATNTVGTTNTAVGFNALTVNTVSGNTAVGSSSLAANTTGTSNTAVGASSLAANTTGIDNTAVGKSALATNTVGTTNTAVGFNALTVNTVSGNTAVGSSSLAANTTGTSNTAVGTSSLAANTIGTSNTAFGFDALAVNTTGINNTAVGANALDANIVGTTNTAVGFNALTNSTVSGNTAVGSSSLAANTTGTGNTAVGLSSLAANTTGIDNTAIGASALATNSVGTTNTAIGFNALTVNTVSGNTAVGSSSLAANTTGTGNVAVGFQALLVNTIGTNNAAIGYQSLTANTTGVSNTAVGFAVLAANTIGTSNTAVGFTALQVNTTGINNTAIGANALNTNTTGTTNTAVGFNALNNSTVSGNTAVGSNSLAADTTGINNTAVGLNSLLVNTTGNDNTAVGSNALAANTIGLANTAVGNSALAANTTGANNVGIGNIALAANTIGVDNIAIGNSALTANTTGNNNVAIGVFALQSNTTASNTAVGHNTLPSVSTGGNNIAIGSGAGGTLTTGSGNIYINANAAAAAEANTIRIGTSQTTCAIAGISGQTTGSGVAVLVNASNVLGTTTSSIQFKHNVQDMNETSEDILKLRPVTFVYNGDETETTQYGLIAEEVDEIFPGIVFRNNDNEIQAVQYHVLPVLLLNEMKKQHNSINHLKNQVAELTINNQTMHEAINNLQEQIKEFVGRIKQLENKA